MSERSDTWAILGSSLDIAVIGGGITGAGVLLEASRLGLRAGLFEAHDFASGTSSRSSKMVHGGLRYLKNAQFRSTLEALREREYPLRDEPGLVRRLDNTILAYRGDRQPAWLTGLGLALYDGMARHWAHERQAPSVLAERIPGLAVGGLLAGYNYTEATTDDAGLVLAVLRRAREEGGFALNYAAVEQVLRKPDGGVGGVAVRDIVSNETREISCRVVVNATGAWSDDVRALDGRPPVLRRLRGSHLFFPTERFPLPVAVSLMHPSDGRPVFAYPWSGVTLVGTTDVDHDDAMSTDVRCTAPEVEYLMAAVDKAFGGFGLHASDAVSSIAGVRPVVRGGHDDPSKESRESLLLDEDGLVSIVGGKLTTFRPMARRALAAALRHLSAARPRSVERARVTSTSEGNTPGDLAALAADGVVHLDDLLLRRTRLGLTVPGGGLLEVRRARSAVQAALGWGDERWTAEEQRYADLWQQFYAPPR